MLKINFTGETSEILEGLSIVAERLGVIIDSSGINVDIKKNGEGFCISGNNDNYAITYETKSDFFRGLAFFADKIKKSEKDFKICQKKKIQTSGTMIDLSNAAVMTVDSLKDFIERSALMGANMMMLYTEDTYEIEKYPHFGYMRGAYTMSELKEIDAYALKFGIEVIPCIQTLAHLTSHLRWRAAAEYKDTANAMLVGADATYELIEEMIKTCREAFSTDRIHIGMDEAFGLGTGQYLRKNGYVPEHEIMDYHLKRVSEIVEKYNYKPMTWSDMFFTSCNKEKYYYIPETQFADEFINNIPENLEMAYWDYEGNHEDRYHSMIEAHKRLNREIVFAGAVWCWHRLTPNFQKTFIATRAALASCKKYGVKTAFMTLWGNMGTQTNVNTLLPAIQLWMDLTYLDDVPDSVLAENFKICTGYNLDQFLLLSCDTFDIEDIKKNLASDCLCINSSVQVYMQDVLYGLLDKTLSGFDFASHYKKFYDEICKLGDMGDMNDVFEMYKVFYSVIYKKSDMGIRLTEAYRSGNKAKLAEIAEEAKIMLDEMKLYHELNFDMWHKRNKPFGWEYVDRRLAGIETRVSSAIKRVSMYLDGRVETLPEFEVERLYFNGYDKPFIELGDVGTYDRGCVTQQ